MSAIDCLCAGIAVADFVCDPIARMPAAGELIMSDRIALTIGGCATNVAVDLARLGRRSAVVARVGNDPCGKFLCEALAGSGVSEAHLVETPDLPTSSTLIINVAGEDRRFIHAAGANSRFAAGDIPPTVLKSTRALYLGGFGLMPACTGEDAARVFESARRAGIITVLDVVLPEPANWWSELQKVLPHTDVFLPNCDEARLLTGHEDPRQQVERFVAAGARMAVVTCGSEGAFAACGAERWQTGVFAVEFVDGTGSGDAFAAGMIDALIDGLAFEQCLESASATGASCVRRAGATTGMFTRDELKTFLASHRLPRERLA